MNKHANKVRNPSSDKWICPKCESRFPKQGPGICPFCKGDIKLLEIPKIGQRMKHIPTGRPVEFLRMVPGGFEIATLDDVWFDEKKKCMSGGSRWSNHWRDLDEFKLVETSVYISKAAWLPLMRRQIESMRIR